MQKIFATVFVLLCCFLTVPAMAQRTVTGTVYDNNNETLPGVSIVIKEHRHIGTLTGSDGRYVLTLPADNKEYTIEVSYIGYASESRKLKSGESQNIDFSMKEEGVDLDMIVITGTRTPKLLKNSPIITKVITENELKKIDATNIGELLQTQLPGIELSYSMNQQVSLNMQGFGGNSVLFLVDGERIAGETLDNIDYSRLNLDNVARVEIIKGAASSLYGSNAVGGVVNIISKVPDEPWSVNVNTRYGTHKDQRHGGTISFNTGRVSNTFNVQHTSIDSINMKNPSVYSKIFGSRTWNVKDRLRYTLNDQITLTGHAGYFFRERDGQTTAKDRYRGFNGGLKGEYALNEKNYLEMSYIFDQYDKSDYSLISEYDIRDYSNVQHSLRALYNYSFGEKNTVTIGGDYMRDYLMSYQFQNNGNYLQHTADIFAQLDWTPVDKFNVIAGLRYDYFSDNDISRVSPKIGLMYKPGKFALRGSYAAGFRAPTLKEKYMVFDMASAFWIYGNPDLKAESSHNFSLSGEYTKSYYNVSLTGYYNLVDNRISAVWDNALDGMLYNNINKIKIVGADANVSAKFPCGIAARLSYTYTHESVDKDKILVTQTRPHTATARIEYGNSWKNYGFNVALNGRFLSKLSSYEYSSDPSSQVLLPVTYPAYTMWKLSLVQDIWKGISLTLAVDNLFDYVPSYYYSNSPYTVGREFSAGLSVDIHRFFK